MIKPTKTSVAALVEQLQPFFTILRREDAHSLTQIPEYVQEIWTRLVPYFRTSLHEAWNDVWENQDDEESLASFRFQLRKLLTKEKKLDEELAGFLGLQNTAPRPFSSSSFQGLDPSDETLRRLEMVRLLRWGVKPEKITKAFNINQQQLFAIHASFTSHGVSGILPGNLARRWFEQLNRDDPMLRRLEMVRLARTGVPAEIAGSEFGAVPEYVEKLSTRFAKNGFAGLLTEEEENKARQSRPSAIRIATYNLHGIHDGNDLRFRYIARELSAFEPEIVAFQEAINGNGIRETSAQVAQKMSAMIGAHYRTFYSHCHLYRETYPEGVAVCARFAFTNPQTIDLNEKLRDGLKPTMPRYASAFQIQIREKKVAVASTHLDHGSSSDVRAAQAEKLVLEMEKLYPHVDILIIAGDMNDVENSLTLEQFRSKGYIDAYRSCQPRGGNTFTADHPHTRIDFILIKGSVKLVSARTILADPRCSDHLGVLVTCI